MTLEGKGYFMWQLPRCDGAEPNAIVDRAVRAGLSHVLIKIADGGYWDYNVDKETEQDYVPPVLQALRNHGIQVWGWHYVRGDSPVTEANQAVKRVRQLGVDGYVIDAEVEYRDRSKWRAAEVFMKELRRNLPDIPVALSSYRYPRTHRDLPFDVFLEGCDYAMPQVYFEQKHNPEEQLERTVEQYMALSHARPVIPTAPTYARGKWRPTPEEIHRFFDKSLQMGLPAANAWSWDFATREPYLDMFQAVAEYPWPMEPTITDMPERLIGRLNQREPAHVTELYLDYAAHVTGSRTIVGKRRVRIWYEKLLGEMLQSAEFEVTGKTISGSSRHFTWKAKGPHGSVQDGKDTISVHEGRILYHYTYFNLEPA